MTSDPFFLMLPLLHIDPKNARERFHFIVLIIILLGNQFSLNVPSERILLLADNCGSISDEDLVAF